STMFRNLARASVSVDGTNINVTTASGGPESSMKVRFLLPEGATVALAEGADTTYFKWDSERDFQVTNPGLGGLSIPMVITDSDGVSLDVMLNAEFHNPLRMATYTRIVSQSGNELNLSSGAATSYILFETRDVEGGYIEVENVSKNLLGRHVIVEGKGVRFYNPVYDIGTATVNVKNAAGETVRTYNVTIDFTLATDYTVVLPTSLRCTYEVDGDNVTVNANAGVSNVQINFGKYYSETLSANVNNEFVKKTGARSWIVYKSETPVEFDVTFDASAYDSDVIVRHITVNF
ncbi:MAG: hypothetical protein II982_04770, partial [Clostridia bacterium]|nr:hypothetical protein [Clostridia bacterium]